MQEAFLFRPLKAVSSVVWMTCCNAMQWNLEPPQCLCFNSLVYLATWTLNIFVFYLNSRSQSKAQIWGITNGESPSLSDLEMIALESSIGSQGKIIPSSPTPRIDDFGSGNLRVCCEDESCSSADSTLIRCEWKLTSSSRECLCKVEERNKVGWHLRTDLSGSDRRQGKRRTCAEPLCSRQRSSPQIEPWSELKLFRRVQTKNARKNTKPFFQCDELL